MARLLSVILVSHQQASSQGALALLPGLLLVVFMLSAMVLILGMCTLKHRSGESKTTSTSPTTSSESDASWDKSGPLDGCMTPLVSTPKATLKKLQWLTKSKDSKRQELLHLEDQYRKQDELLWDNNSGSAVWQRTILMGEKCEPPAFSGLILYDERGNRVPEFPAKSPRAASVPPRVLS